jgi:hypothetical protein
MGKKIKRRVVLVVMLLLVAAYPALAQQPADVDEILQGAESLFKAMKQRDYPGIWKYISARSRTTIVETTAKGVLKSYSREQVETDFSIGGLIAKSYWDEYLRYFDPDAALEQSKWEMGTATRQQAEIILQHRKSAHPARLKMFKEEGQWKVGLIESFGIERRDRPLW